MELILSLVRNAMVAGGAYFTDNGLLTSDEANTAVGALITLGGVSWSLIKAYKERKAKKAADASK